MNRLLCLTALLAAATLPACAQSKKPVDLALGWSYAYSDEGTGFANLNGWYGSANWEASSRIGIAFEHESFWGHFQGAGANQHVWLGGLTFQLRSGSPRVKPFLQPMGGVTRSSSSGSVQQEPTFQLAAGADISLKGNLSFEVVPAEYTFTYGNSTAENTYQAAAGLQYSFGK